MVRLLIPAVLSAALAAFIVVVLMTGEVSAAGATAAGTILLTAVTLYYAVEASRTRSQAAKQWSEELEDRRQERRDAAIQRRHQQSTEAARRILARFSDLGFSGGLPRVSGDEELHALREVAPAIDGALFEIDDDEVVERLAVCSLVATTANFPEAEFGGAGGKGLAQLLARSVVTQTRWTLEAHVGGRALPSWPELPRRHYAQAWLMTSGRSGRNEWLRWNSPDAPDGR